MDLLLGCPYQVKVQYFGQEKSVLASLHASLSPFVPFVSGAYDPSGGPYKLLREYYETYTIQSGTFGGRDWYLSSSGNAIWYKDGTWRVGTKGDKGTTRGVFYTNDDDKCPHQPGFKWKYYVKSINDWVDAGYGMSIYTVS